MVSVGANISEGCSKSSDIDKARFLQIALGSESEVEFLLILCKDLDYIDKVTVVGLEYKIQEIKKMLSKLIIIMKH